MSEFFAMGGYAFYVWTSFLISALVLVLNLVIPMQQTRRLRNEIKSLLRREERQREKNI